MKKSNDGFWAPAARFSLKYTYFGLIFLMSVVFVVPPQKAAAATPYNATDVLGQLNLDGSPNFTNDTKDNGKPSVNNQGFDAPTGIALDKTRHRLYVGEMNNRVMVFNLNSSNELLDRTADYVLGQPNFQSETFAVSDHNLDIWDYGYAALAIDEQSGYLYVSDTASHRVIVFDTKVIANGMDASYVLGQEDFDSANPDLDRDSMENPFGLILDTARDLLFVADGENHRILIFDTDNLSNGMDASYVLGQEDFDTNDAVDRAQDRFDAQYMSFSYDSQRKYLFASDWIGKRVLVFNLTTITNGMDASYVLGQTDFTSNGFATSQTGFRGPQSSVYDEEQKLLFITDNPSNRIVVYDVASITNGEPAVGVLGQVDFVTRLLETPTSSSFDWIDAISLTFDGTLRRLYAPDTVGNRVLIFDFIKLQGSLSSGTIGSIYTTSELGSNYQGTVTYEITSGTLAPGLSLDGSTGIISGTPTTAGSYTFTVRASDDNGVAGTYRDSQQYVLSIASNIPNSQGGSDDNESESTDSDDNTTGSNQEADTPADDEDENIEEELTDLDSDEPESIIDQASNAQTATLNKATTNFSLSPFGGLLILGILAFVAAMFIRLKKV